MWTSTSVHLWWTMNRGWSAHLVSITAPVLTSSTTTAATAPRDSPVRSRVTRISQSGGLVATNVARTAFGDVMSMWSLRWHFTNKSDTGAPYSIKSYSLSVHAEVELCAPTSLRRTRDERRRWRQTAAVVTVVRKYPRKPSCSNPPLSPQVHALVSTRWCVSANDAHCVFDEVLQNTLSVSVWGSYLCACQIQPNRLRCRLPLIVVWAQGTVY